MQRKVIVGIAVAVMLIAAPLAYIFLSNYDDNDNDTEEWKTGYYLEYTEVTFEVVVIDGNSTVTPWMVSFKERWEVTEVNGDHATFHHQTWTYDPAANSTLIRYSSENLTLSSEGPFEPLHSWVADHADEGEEQFISDDSCGRFFVKTYAVQGPASEGWGFSHGIMISHWTSERFPGDSEENYTEARSDAHLTGTNLPWLLNDDENAYEGS
ncbi:MAG: hypothetical protein AB9860_03640 [Methanomassiliicoccales archaeon]